MVMSIDEPWQDHVPWEIEDFVRSWRQLVRGSNLIDESITDEKTTIGDLPLVVIHCDNVCMPN